MFGLSYGKTKVSDLGDALVKTIAKFDPEGASAAQIEEYKHHVDDLANIAAKAASSQASDQKIYDDLSARFNQFKQVAIQYSGMLSTITDPVELARKTKIRDEALTNAEQLKSQMTDAANNLADSKSYYQEALSAHQDAVANLTTAKSRLENAKREQERAHQQAEIAIERQHDRERLMGLNHGLDPLNAAVDAMTANAAADRQKAAAAKMTTEALGKTTEVDNDLALALKEVNAPTPVSVEDRLKNL